MPSPEHPKRKTENLYRGRLSVAGARYFVTFVTELRKPWLGRPETRQLLLATWRAWQAEGRGRILAATVMPDHVHVLFELGDGVTVGQAVARWKADVRRAIDHTETFQRDFWEHRLRAEDAIEDYALYLFLNPYRAGYAASGEGWPGWWAPDPAQFRFASALEDNLSPPQEWIDWPESRFEDLALGE